MESNQNAIGTKMDSGEAQNPARHRVKKVDHLELAESLKQQAIRLREAMVYGKDPGIGALHRQGIRAQENYVECLFERFQLEQRYVWLDKSNTLGLEVRAVRDRNDASGRSLGQLLLHPDNLAMMLPGDREFSRSTATVEDISAVACVFLKPVADSAIVGLSTVAF